MNCLTNFVYNVLVWANKTFEFAVKATGYCMKKFEQASTVAHNTLTGLNSKWYILSNGTCIPATYYPQLKNNMGHILWIYDMKTNSLRSHEKGTGYYYNTIEVMNCVLEYNMEYSQRDIRSVDITGWLSNLTYSSPPVTNAFFPPRPLYPSAEMVFLCYQIYHKQWFVGNKSVRFCILTNDADEFEIEVQNRYFVPIRLVEDNSGSGSGSWKKILNIEQAVDCWDGNWRLNALITNKNVDENVDENINKNVDENVDENSNKNENEKLE
jgi:hypothetical protein